MAVGIEINGGGNHKIIKSKINLNDSDSKAIVMNQSFTNEVIDVQIIIESTVEKLKEMEKCISALKDDSINPKTSNKYKDDILNTIPNLMNEQNEQTAIVLISLLSSWITIKTELTTQLTPYIDYLATIIGS